MTPRSPVLLNFVFFSQLQYSNPCPNLTISASTRSFYVIIADDIRSCSANGNEYPLGRSFQFTDGCFRYGCQCHSDGSWECPADSVVDTCQHTSNGKQTIEQTARRCKYISGTHCVIANTGIGMGERFDQLFICLHLQPLWHASDDTFYTIETECGKMWRHDFSVSIKN